MRWGSFEELFTTLPDYFLKTFSITNKDNFCTKQDIIKHSRSNARFHLQKKGDFFILRDMSEEYVPSTGYVWEDER